MRSIDRAEIAKYLEKLAPLVVEPCSLGKSFSLRRLVFAYFAVSFLLILSGCTERPGKADARDACSLLSKEDVESVRQRA
jgi:hypothetical protein